MLYSSRTVNSLRVENTSAFIYRGQAWISFYNAGKKDATIKSYDDDDNVVGTWTIPAKTPFALPPDIKDGKEWGKFEIISPETIIEAVFEDKNINR